MSLSSLLVQREIASIREVEEALARQVLYGGDLITNLLELTHLEEAGVTAILAESFGRDAAPVGELPAPSKEAKALMTAELCVQHAVVPLSLGDGTLVVATAEPLATDVVHDLGFTLSVTLAQRIAPHVRVQEAIAREYGVALERRIDRLLVRLRGGETGSSAGSSPKEPPVVAPPPRPLSELPRIMSRSRDDEGDSEDRPRPPAPHGAVVSARVVYAPEIRGGLKDVLAELKRPEPGPPATVVEGRPQRRSTPPEREPPKTRVKKPRRRRGPMVTETANAEMESAEDRDTILEILFEYSRQFFDYTALFIVHGEIAEGWDAFGDGASRERVLEIGVPLDMPSLLATARANGRVIHAMPTLQGLDGVWLKDLGLRGETALVIAPVIVGRRPVAMLIGDGGAAGVDPETVDQAAWISGLAGAAFERIIVRRKVAGYQKPDRPAAPAGAAPVPPPPRVPSLDVPPPAPMPPEPEPAMDPVPPTARSGPPPKGPEDAPAAPPPEPPQAETTPASTLLGERPPLSLAAEIIAAPIIEIAKGVSEEPPPVSVEVPLDDAPPSEPEEPQPVSIDVPVPSVEPPPPMPSAPASVRSKAPPSVPPDSEQRAVPLHAPPSKQAVGVKLPSIIVADTFGDFKPMVDRFLDAGDEKTRAELLRAGQDAMPAIMSRFPGPLKVDLSRLDETPGPRASECGPLLALVAGQRKVALPFVVEVTGDSRVDFRVWATLLLAELSYLEAAGTIALRLFDEDRRVRRVAHVAARALAESHPAAMHDRVSKIALDATEPAERRALALEALGELQHASVVPSLVTALSDPNADLAAAAHAALVVTTRHDLGADPRKWLMFWQATGHKHRVEWLIDALTLENAALVAPAAAELVLLTRDAFGYTPDAPRKDRERAQSRFRAWWATEGRGRHRKG